MSGKAKTARQQARLREFWADAAAELVWDAPYTSICDETSPTHPNWFSGGRLNTCYNAVDRHVDDGRGDKTALIFESGYTEDQFKFTYRELQKEVAQLAGMIAAQGVAAGDRVIIYMPMVHQAVIAMLACARLGAVHSVVFGGFAANELAKRIDDAEPVLILSASCGIEPGRTIAYKPILDDALELASHKPKRCIILQRPMLDAELKSGRDLDWEETLAVADPHPCVPVAATDPLYILYTSGTTGIPKGVQRDNAGHAVALLWSMKNVYDARQDDVYWAASDIGWVVGHSYIVYGPLLLGCTSIIYEGKPVGTPDAAQFWRLIERHGVNILFTAPTAIRAVKKEDPAGKLLKDFDLSSLRSLFLAGERSDPDTIEWSKAALGVPVVDHWWQTELGWPAAATSLGLGESDIRVGAAGRPVPGYHFACLDEDHTSVDAGETGDLVIQLPLPPGCLQGLWNNPEGFHTSYFEAHPGYYLTGDAGFIDEDGFIHVMSRTDDVINVAGHRLSTGSIEEIISAHTDIAECAVVGVPDSLKGEVPIALFVLNAGDGHDVEAISSEVIKDVRAQLGAVASFKIAICVPSLPKTRSGKTLRGVIRKIARGQSYTMPATIDDAGALDVVERALSGYALNA